MSHFRGTDDRKTTRLEPFIVEDPMRTRRSFNTE